MPTSDKVTMEFHVSRRARDRYQFDQSLFSLAGNIIFANFHAARVFSQKMNQKRDLIHFPEQGVKAGQINAMGLIDEILHFVIGLYRQQRNPQAIHQALEWLYDRMGQDAVDNALGRFAEEFPSLAIYRRELSVENYLESQTDGIPNREILLEELLLLWLENANPAFSPYIELFDDSELEKGTSYLQIIKGLHDFFDVQPPFGPESQNLVDMLRSPAIAVPHSLPGQLEYIRQRWGFLLGQYLFRLLTSLDVIREEEKAIFLGPGPVRIYDFAGLQFELERFSPDSAWMPSLVLIAKNAYVWMDQLSKQYRQYINRLDLIPDEELDKLARWGFSGLWLIGLWERSAASQRIKQLRGNPDAVASAYSLFDYQIAADLGGDESYQSLSERAWQRGIRLASDMVPNHMGIDSRWVIEHPDWFISLDYSPFPAYSFNGLNLSWDERVGIYLEDHYYDNTDAAVVFKRVDHWSGNPKYIYHGNDGTSMPWNDTAQLNYLLPEVREAVIQTILHVARRFPIIRFDAAMTLAKKHYQRLWFPEPGTGGAIPTRAEQGLTKEQFNSVFPVEFWREVVDRVAQEVPDTLLLAEAFWLMEGYFVRTLGMHRVYNSAFMNMLRDEKNQEYRLVIKNTLEFDPEILKRYVNFMSNPDERTAIDQFGKGDKYFGICTLMATMPGLPMFGHGQIEGYTEKYGMEFRRAYWEESSDGYLVERHEREIFPLLRRRYIFAEARDFLLYDFYSPEGYVNEDVFAFSNRSGEEKALVVYHNRYTEARGWIRNSAASSVKIGREDERILVHKNLGEGLGLRNEENYYTIFHDQISGLEFIRESRKLHQDGLYVELGAYKYHVFMDFQEILDNEWHQYAQLTEYLNGRGVPSITEILKEIFLQPIHYPFRELVSSNTLRRLVEARVFTPDERVDGNLLAEIEQKSAHLLREINVLTSSGRNEIEIAEIAGSMRESVRAILEIPQLDAQGTSVNLAQIKDIYEFINFIFTSEGETESKIWGILFGWAFTKGLGQVVFEADAPQRSRSWIDEWLLGKILVSSYQDFGVDEGTAWWMVNLVKILVNHQEWFMVQAPKEERAYVVLQSWLQDEDIQRFLKINRYQEILWYNKESFEQLLQWIMIVTCVGLLAKTGIEGSPVLSQIINQYQVIKELRDAEEKSAFQVERLLEGAKAKLVRKEFEIQSGLSGINR